MIAFLSVQADFVRVVFVWSLEVVIDHIVDFLEFHVACSLSAGRICEATWTLDAAPGRSAIKSDIHHRKSNKSIKSAIKSLAIAMGTSKRGLRAPTSV